MVILYFSPWWTSLASVVVVQLLWRCRALAGARFDMFIGLINLMDCWRVYISKVVVSELTVEKPRFVDASTSRKCRCRMVVSALRM